MRLLTGRAGILAFVVSSSVCVVAIGCKPPADVARKDMLRDARIGCDKGSASACFHAGLLYAESNNAERSQASHAKGCALKHAGSCDALAAVKGSNRERLLAEACSAGDLVTCARLADEYPKDPAGLARARALDEQVCRMASATTATTTSRELEGAALGCSKLALIHAKGEGGVRADATMAMKLETLATALFTEALFRLEKQQDEETDREIGSRPITPTDKDRAERETDQQRHTHEALIKTLDVDAKAPKAEGGAPSAATPLTSIEQVWNGPLVFAAPPANANANASANASANANQLDDAAQCKESGDVLSCAIAGGQIEKTDPNAALDLHVAGCAKRPDQCWSLIGFAESVLKKKDAARAAAALEKGCELKSANACVRLATETEVGERGIAQDFAKTGKLLDKACEFGSARGCMMFATLVEDGRGVAKNAARAKQLRAKAETLDNPARRPAPSSAELAADEEVCRRTHVSAKCEAVASAMQDFDAVKAEELFRIGCPTPSKTTTPAAASSPVVCGLWGFALDRFRRDDAGRGMRLLNQGCQDNAAIACLVLGEIHHLGYRSVPRAEALAAERYQKACDIGDSLGCRISASRFRGVKNIAKADELRDRAARSDEEADKALGADATSDRWARAAAAERTRGPQTRELERVRLEWRALVEKARTRAQARTQRLETAYAGRKPQPMPAFTKEDQDIATARDATIRRTMVAIFLNQKSSGPAAPAPAAPAPAPAPAPAAAASK